MINSTQYDVERKYSTGNYMDHNYTTCIKGSYFKISDLFFKKCLGFVRDNNNNLY